MLISTRSSKEELLYVSDPTRLERSIRKERCSPSIDNNTSSPIDTRQPQSTETPSSSADTRPPPSTEATLLSSDIFHPTSIDASPQTSIDTEPRDMVANIILIWDENGDLHDHEGHLCNAAGQKVDAQGAVIPEPSTATEDAKVLQPRTMAELIRPSQIYTNRSAIQPPVIQGVDMKARYFAHVAQHPFLGFPQENPFDHIETLVILCLEYIRMKQPQTTSSARCSSILSLEKKNWLRHLPPGSLTTWSDVRTAFLTKFFNEGKADEIRDKIWTFSQEPTEAFRSSWERFRRYQRDCPHHGFTEIHLLKRFVKGFNVRYHMMLDTASKENFETRTPEEAKRLI